MASSSFCSRPVFREASRWPNTAAPENFHNKTLNLLPKTSCNNASSSLTTKPRGKNINNNNKNQKQKQRSSYQIDFYTYYKDSTNQKKSLKNHNKILNPFPNVSHYWECSPPKQLKMLWETPSPTTTSSCSSTSPLPPPPSSSSTAFGGATLTNRVQSQIKQCNASWKGKKQISSLLQKKRKKKKMKWKLSNKTLLTMLLFDSLVLLLAS